MKKIFLIIILVLIVLISGIGTGSFIYYSSLFGAPQSKTAAEQFTVALNSNQQGIVDNLFKQGFIKSEWGFNFVLGNKNLFGKIQPGGYQISKSMTAWQIEQVFSEGPQLKWVVIPEGLRKEQIAEILAKELSWTDQKKSDWILKFTVTEDKDYFEGVYFPNTYLIPKDESPADVAKRLINKFNEEFAPYADKFIKANVKWTTALKVASIVQREGLGKSDMPLIAGIIWNRLTKNMNLEIDATVQYARDDQIHFSSAGYVSQGSWWSPIKPADEKIDSPYNTYLYAGLPPHPIDNPGLEAIDATLNSADTDCLYYLHDRTGQIHCAATLQEHDANIKKYLE